MFLKKNSYTFCQGLTPGNFPGMIICKSLHWPEYVRKACNLADTICQGFSQGMCQECICQELKPWQGHLRWADLLGILLLAKLLTNVHLPRLSAFCQGFCPWQNAIFLVVYWVKSMWVSPLYVRLILKCGARMNFIQ